MTPQDKAAPGLEPWQRYERKGVIEARAWTAEDAERYVHGGQLGLNTISVSKADCYVASRVNSPAGFVARNPDNHADQWYIAPDYFAKHYERSPSRESQRGEVLAIAKRIMEYSSSPMGQPRREMYYRACDELKALLTSEAAHDRCQICGGDLPCHCDQPEGIP